MMVNQIYWIDISILTLEISTTVYYNVENDVTNTLKKLLEDLHEDATKEKGITKKYFIDVEYYKKFVECLDMNKYQQLSRENNA